MITPLLNRVNSPATSRAAATAALLALVCLCFAVTVLRCSASAGDGETAGTKMPTSLRQQRVVSELSPLTKASRDFASLARKIASEAFDGETKRQFEWAMTDIPG